MGEWKKILPKALLLIVLLAGMNFVYRRFLLPADIAAHSEAAGLVAAVQDTSDILYLGESSNFTIADEDVEKLSISQFLAQYFPSLRLGTIAKGALHAGNYYDMLRSIPAHAPVKTVVVTMNLRSFDATWIHSKLETALQKEMVLLKPGPALWRRLMLSLRAYEVKTEAERRQDALDQWARDTLRFPVYFPYSTVLAWDSAIANRADRIRQDYGGWANGSSIGLGIRFTPREGIKERTWPETSLAAHYVKNFAFQIDTTTDWRIPGGLQASNPRIRDFDRIVELAQDRGWNLVFSILPENMDQAEYLAGAPLTYLMRQNRNVLLRRYGNFPHVTVVDQMESLPSEDFRDVDWTTEHYLEHGRRTVAHGLAQALKTLHPEAYAVPKGPQVMSPGLFSNDCEGQTQWSQMQTLDKGKAHSGKSSSVTGPGKSQFGITFAYPVTKMDRNLLDSLDFSCWVHQASRAHNAAIAWEAGGEMTGYLWDSLQLRGLTAGAGDWQQVRFRVPLWLNVSQAEIIKVYPYNPSQEVIWFDDIRIEFIRAK